MSRKGISLTGSNVFIFTGTGYNSLHGIHGCDSSFLLSMQVIISQVPERAAGREATTGNANITLREIRHVCSQYNFRVIFKSGQTLSPHHADRQVKDRLPDKKSFTVVYQIPCDCGGALYSDWRDHSEAGDQTEGALAKRLITQ